MGYFEINDGARSKEEAPALVTTKHTSEEKYNAVHSCGVHLKINFYHLRL